MRPPAAALGDHVEDQVAREVRDHGRFQAASPVQPAGRDPGDGIEDDDSGGDGTAERHERRRRREMACAEEHGADDDRDPIDRRTRRPAGAEHDRDEPGDDGHEEEPVKSSSVIPP